MDRTGIRIPTYGEGAKITVSYGIGEFKTVTITSDDPNHLNTFKSRVNEQFPESTNWKNGAQYSNEFIIRMSYNELKKKLIKWFPKANICQLDKL